ncbi:MAG: tRNA (adenosine(37)-N6)-dimethylallyltransferase MiaA [Candidatus Aminicenantes bacterium]|nr:tRNA (adenosine(37)-N6)-dimethylallyltransferase MiaA [Candidatus Aminicenantes bacterium]
MEFKDKNLLVILGPTCVGKSATALKCARDFNAEIINCDSMQVYQGFDIGTDKIPPENRENIPHHLISIIKPSTQFTAADFVKKSLEAIQSIQKRKKLPIITGGTGLYLKALLNGLYPEKETHHTQRSQLEKEADEFGLEKLRRELKKVDPEYHDKIGKNDRLRIIRALEVYRATKKPLSEHFLNTTSFVEDFDVIKIGLITDRKSLYQRIENRVDRMFEKGMVKEVQALLESGVKEDSPPFRAIGYKHILKFLNNEITLKQAIRSTKKSTRHYAKRQITWFNKMEGIKWFSPYDYKSIKQYISDRLKKWKKQ